MPASGIEYCRRFGKFNYNDIFSFVVFFSAMASSFGSELDISTPLTIDAEDSSVTYQVTSNLDNSEFIYVYDIGSYYNTYLQKVTSNGWSVQYEPEYEVFEMFAQRNISRTMDPTKATLFYIPFLSTRYTFKEIVTYDAEGFLDALKKTSNMWHQVLSLIRSEYPYFDKSNGRDHFSVLTIDHGRCQALTYVDPSTYGEMFFLQINADKMVRSIHISTERGIQALTYNYRMKVSTEIPDIPCYMSERDIPIPPISDVNISPAYGKNRPITALFQFSAVHDHGVLIPHFNHYLRQDLLNLYGNKGYEGWSVGAKPENSSAGDLEESKFCVCPPGHSQWTPCPFNAIRAGCVPVNFFRDHDYPWMDELNYHHFSININPDKIYTVKLAIEYILSKPGRFAEMQQELQKVQEAFQWGPGFRNGARARVLRALLRKAFKIRGLKPPCINE